MKIEIELCEDGYIACIENKKFVAKSLKLIAERLTKHIKKLNNSSKEAGVKIGVKKISNSQ